MFTRSHRRSVPVVAAAAFIAALSTSNAIAAISFRASATNSVNTATSLTITKPTGVVANDVLVAAISARGGTGTTITAPAGWTLIRRDDSATVLAMATYSKVAGASEPASYQWTFGGSIRAAGGIDA